MTIEHTEPAEFTEPSGLVAALAAVQAEIPAVEKANIGRVRSEKANYEYRYADLSEVTAAILPLLGRHGLAWTTQPMMTDRGFVLRYTLLHSSGERLTGEYPLPDPARTAPQQVGSALTYARRYCLCAVTGVAPGDDDDDAAAAQNQFAGRSDAPRRPSAQTRRSAQQARRSTARADAPAQPPGSPGDHSPTDADATASRGGAAGLTGDNPDGPLSDRTRNRLMAAFTRAGLDPQKDRGNRLRVCAEVVGHDVASANDLTEGEGLAIIAAFNRHRSDVPGWLRTLLKPTDPDAAEAATDDSDGDDGDGPAGDRD